MFFEYPYKNKSRGIKSGCLDCRSTNHFPGYLLGYRLFKYKKASCLFGIQPQLKI